MTGTLRASGVSKIGWCVGCNPPVLGQSDFVVLSVCCLGLLGFSCLVASEYRMCVSRYKVYLFILGLYTGVFECKRRFC
jgi:hypothetical protein